jgi:hypothetical protein
MTTLNQPRQWRVIQSLALALGGVLLPISGCIPVGWLPDSSGFIYTGGREFDRLIHYDLATGEHRVLLEKMPAHTPTVAISPEGKRIAVAHLRRGKDRNMPETMQVLIYDLKGKLLHSSAEFPWGANRRRGEDDHPNTGVFWVAQAGTLLVQDYGEPGRTGIYNLQKDTMQRVLDGTPSVYGGTPVRPDGKRFLVMGDQPGAGPEPEMFLVDWKGEKERIPPKWEIKDQKIHGDEILGLLQAPWKGTSEWQGQVALATYGTLRVRIDTEKRTGIIDELRREDATVDGKELLQRYAFPRSGIKLRLVLAEKTKSNNPVAPEDVHLHLQLVPPGEKKPKLLLQIRNGFSRLSPSPDGKWVAIRTMSDTTRADEILLVSETGQVREVRGERQDAPRKAPKPEQD